MVNGSCVLYGRSMIWRAGLVGLWIVASLASQQIDQLTCALWLCISLAHERGMLGTNEVVPDAPDGGVPATTAAPGTNGTGTTDSDATTAVNEEADTTQQKSKARTEQETIRHLLIPLHRALAAPALPMNDHQEKTDDDGSDTASDCYTTATEGPDTDVSDDESIDSARSVSSVF